MKYSKAQRSINIDDINTNDYSMQEKPILNLEHFMTKYNFNCTIHGSIFVNILNIVSVKHGKLINRQKYKIS